MVRYSEEEVIATGHKIIKDFDNPALYLNHCTDKLPMELHFMEMTPTRRILRRAFGEERIQDCKVGTSLKFEV